MKREKRVNFLIILVLFLFGLTLTEGFAQSDSRYNSDKNLPFNSWERDVLSGWTERYHICPAVRSAAQLPNSRPWAAMDLPSQSHVIVTVGETVAFSVLASHFYDELSGSEWWLGNNSRFQYVSATDGGSASAARFFQSYTFEEVGRTSLNVKTFTRSSVYSNGVRWMIDVVLPTRGIYVSRFDEFLGDDCEEDRLLDFMARNYIRSLTPYGMTDILASDVKRVQLTNFMSRARELFGDVEFNAPFGSLERIAEILEFNEECERGFDAVTTEVEYWNDVGSECHQPGVHLTGEAQKSWARRLTTFQQYRALLVAAREMLEQAMDGGESRLRLQTYLGYPCPTEAAGIRDLADRIFLNYYVDNPNHAYHKEYVKWGSLRDRLQFVAGADIYDSPIEIWPIFLVRTDDGVPTPDDMGPWFIGDRSLGDVQSIFMSDFSEDTSPFKSRIAITGFQYFSYPALAERLSSLPPCEE